MTRVRTICLAIAGAAALALAAPATAQAQAPSPPKTAPAKAPPAKGTPVLPGGNSKDPISIDANKLEYFDKEQKAVYTGGVVVVQGESSMKCTVLTIFLTKTAKDGAAGAPAPAQGATQGAAGGGTEVTRMEATGPVTVIQKDQVGTGDKGIYDKVENKVYLIGNVTLSQGPNVTKGDKLTYDMEKGTALIESGKGGPVKGLFIPGSGPADANGTPGPKKPKPGVPPAAPKS